MSINQILYASTDTLYFKITLAGVGVNYTLVNADVKLSQDGATGGNVSTVPVAIDATNLPGVYSWSPTVAESACEVMILNITDSVGGRFDQNCIIVPTGGHTSARFRG